MRTSENINELAKALSVAQGQLKSAPKDSVNPFFKSNYADLTAVVETAKEALSKNGLSIIQGAKKLEDGTWVMVTKLCHSSGQWIESDYPILTKDNSPQGFGSGVTYARRYSYQPMVGITAEQDDDGEVATGRLHTKADNNSQHSQKPPVSRVTGAQVYTPALPIKNQTTGDLTPVAAISTSKSEVKERAPTEAQLKRLYAITKASGWADKEVKDLIFNQYGKDSVRDLNSVEYDKTCQWIQTTPPPQAGMMEQF